MLNCSASGILTMIRIATTEWATVKAAPTVANSCTNAVKTIAQAAVPTVLLLLLVLLLLFHMLLLLLLPLSLYLLNFILLLLK
jgi:hypothetical protein